MMADTASPEAVNLVGTTILGPSPNTVHYINAQSYQQDALLTCGGEQGAAEPVIDLLSCVMLLSGWQYVGFWQDVAGSATPMRHLHLGRRRLPSMVWEFFEFLDYEQTTDDNHNVMFSVNFPRCAEGLISI
jgi:hypothetical protein